jgi:hypothetical protein
MPVITQSTRRKLEDVGKVTMDDAPWFDAPDQFSHDRLILADIAEMATSSNSGAVMVGLASSLDHRCGVPHVMPSYSERRAECPGLHPDPAHVGSAVDPRSQSPITGGPAGDFVARNRPLETPTGRAADDAAVPAASDSFSVESL